MKCIPGALWLCSTSSSVWMLSVRDIPCLGCCSFGMLSQWLNVFPCIYSALASTTHVACLSGFPAPTGVKNSPCYRGRCYGATSCGPVRDAPYCYWLHGENGLLRGISKDLEYYGTSSPEYKLPGVEMAGKSLLVIMRDKTRTLPSFPELVFRRVILMKGLTQTGSQGAVFFIGCKSTGSLLFVLLHFWIFGNLNKVNMDLEKHYF